uniref:Uncharacterized protein n=1 Tax=Phlegmariurus squarrosus TaxID=73615 RepID=H9M885_PHLSQ|nr:hypothetical protein HusqMp33 [Phlegmariurus squarrosus]YP_006234351.1 hypothetical protein HusqMp111 [Phlegmariurus squarrosus]AEV55747.1 hypothetical protein HusqMp33 [Phlegmariurus squarrosus]AEV55792.1 hypothetical protein HusqMp111 [Phlegmariurus squarrosus]
MLSRRPLFNGFAARARRAVLQIAVAGGAAARLSFIKAYFRLPGTKSFGILGALACERSLSSNLFWRPITRRVFLFCRGWSSRIIFGIFYFSSHPGTSPFKANKS